VCEATNCSALVIWTVGDVEPTVSINPTPWSAPRPTHQAVWGRAPGNSPPLFILGPMVCSTQLSYGGQLWAKLQYSSMQGVGRVYPHLLFHMLGSSFSREVRVTVPHLRVELSVGDELMASGELVQAGTELHSDGTQLTLSVPVSREAVRHIEQAFRGPTLGLKLGLRGFLAIQDDRPAGQQQTATILALGQYAPLEPAELQFPVHRSEWVASVLEPLGHGKYVMMDFPVPPTPDSEPWTRALRHIERADEQYGLGNDPGVFQDLRAAFEKGSIDSAPKEMFAFIGDERKREAINGVVQAAVKYFHTGRHVTTTGPGQGHFPVDHRDAEFALALGKICLAYTAKLHVAQNQQPS
jgi:hypothetical protein